MRVFLREGATEEEEKEKEEAGMQHSDVGNKDNKDAKNTEYSSSRSQIEKGSSKVTWQQRQQQQKDDNNNNKNNNDNDNNIAATTTTTTTSTTTTT